MDFRPTFKNTDEINSIAESFLEKYHSSFLIPIPIEDIIDQKLKINIVPMPDLKDSFGRAGFDVDAFISADFEDIVIDQYIYFNINNRFRFSLAHEIAHMLLHNDVYKKYKFNDRSEYIKFIEEMPRKERGWFEWQADELAGLILVPRKVLKSEFMMAIEKIENLTGMSKKQSEEFIVDEAIGDILAPKFEVSNETMRIRLQKDKLIV